MECCGSRNSGGYTGIPTYSGTLNDQGPITKLEIVQSLNGHICYLRIEVLGKSEAL